MTFVDRSPASAQHLTVRVPEFGTVEVPVEAIVPQGRLAIYPSLEGRGYLSVSVGRHATTIQAKGHIGIIPVNDALTLEITPRVPLANLARLLERSGRAPQALAHAFRLYETEGVLYPSLAGVYAEALYQQVQSITERGLLKEYERVEATTSFPHGRLEVGKTMQRHHSRGVLHRAEVAWFHRSADNPANRCLRYAVWRLAAYAHEVRESLTAKQRHQIDFHLNLTDRRLQGVALDLREEFLGDPIVSGRAPLPALRGYYRPALDIALTVCGRQAVVLERHGSRIRLPSLLVNMSDVFEAYVRAVLRTAEGRGSALRVLDGNLKPPAGAASELFADGTHVLATPDIVYARGDKTVLVLDVKYKPAERLPSRDDLNQVITYGLAYGVQRVGLVEPQSERRQVPAGLHRLGSISGLEVHRYITDLAAPDLREQERLMTTALRDLAVA
jgi:5-methylcytosine-specific restriction enzyme subunit McrC